MISLAAVPLGVSATVLLVEDQTAIRQLLAAYVGSIPGFSVVGECASASEAVRLCGTLSPSLVILDWMLEDGIGQQVLTQIINRPQRPRVLVFSANTTKLAVHEAFGAGAAGFIEKTAEFGEFTDALRAVAAGKPYLGPAVSELVKSIVRSPREDDLGSSMSGRERQVLRMVAAGHSSKEIADRLGISVRTVNSHRAAVIRKTGLHSVAALTRHAFESGLMGEPRLLAACA